MAQLDLARLWNAIASSADSDRPYLNDLDDIGDGDAGDNYRANMQTIADVLQRSLQGGQGDTGQALLEAANALRDRGHGATAPIYAAGLDEAGKRLQGRSGLSFEDLMPLLEGLLNGAKQGSSTPQGEGGMLDALVPGVMAYLGAKQNGASDMEALMDALSSARQGTYSTRRKSPNIPAFGDRDTTGQLDPGAAGVGSLFEGLLRGILQQGGSTGQTQPQAQPQGQKRPTLGGSVDM